jgi:UDP-N-acetylmuramyl tripeptide synthase
VVSHLAGEVNILNLLAALAAAHARGVPFADLVEFIPQLKPVPGRFQSVDAGQPFTVIVDYAHTDDALLNLTALARQMTARTGGRVITLFGCGGDRDRTKRPKMGLAAGKGSDFVVATSDNPRTEEPLAILAEIEPGLKASGVRYTVEPDRTSAYSPRAGRSQGGRRGSDRRQRPREGADCRLHGDSLRRCKNCPFRAGRNRLSWKAMKLTLAEAAISAGAVLEAPSSAANAGALTVAGYSIDSRTVAAGELFFAVRGERLDGHDYIVAAIERGAVAAVVSRARVATLPDAALSIPLLITEDPLIALQALATHIRRRWGRRVVAVTGSAGKTTTKEAIAAALGAKFNVHKSQGNMNNNFGVPLQLLRLKPSMRSRSSRWA